MGGPSDRHEISVATLVEGGCRTRGFSAALRAIGIGLGRHPIIPDAFRVDHERKVVAVYEVLVTHAVSEGKHQILGLIDDMLHALGWSLELWIVHDGRAHQVDPATGRVSSEELREAVESIGR